MNNTIFRKISVIRAEKCQMERFYFEIKFVRDKAQQHFRKMPNLVNNPHVTVQFITEVATALRV